ncbi:MAG: hypothetical protein NWF07_16915 [Candidatus Bathyarchaeota archaeon]|nr:hypothetical protein [Candidatus Bathyarchaeota archaeon]
MSHIPEFPELLRLAETKLTQRLGGSTRVQFIRGYDEEIQTIIHAIDKKKFREELRYTLLEIEQRMMKPGFLCLLVYLDDEPIAFEYGYDVSEGVYFSDSQAALIEGKGVGTTQFALEILYLYKKGYKQITLSTEELDDQGRTLRSFWERMGFSVTNRDAGGNVDMMMELSPETAYYQYERYIKPR